MGNNLDKEEFVTIKVPISLRDKLQEEKRLTGKAYGMILAQGHELYLKTKAEILNCYNNSKANIL